MKKEPDRRILEEIFIIDTSNTYEKQLIQQSFDAVELFVAVIDLSGNIVLINHRGRELLGYNNDEIIGKNFIEEFIIRTKRSKARERFDHVIKGRLTPSVNTRYYLKTRKSRNIILEAKNKIFRDKKNKVAGVILSGKNISGHLARQQNLQNAERTLMKDFFVC